MTRWLRACLAGVVLLAVSAPAHSQGTEWTSVDIPLPELDLVDLKGRRWTKADLAGKVTVVNLWATWCVPCEKELPLFQQFYEEIQKRKDLVVLAFNVDDETAEVAPYVGKKGLTMPVLLALSLVEALGAEGIPVTYLVDREGIIRRQSVGFDGNAKAWRADLVAEIAKVGVDVRQPEPRVARPSPVATATPTPTASPQSVLGPEEIDGPAGKAPCNLVRAATVAPGPCPSDTQPWAPPAYRRPLEGFRSGWTAQWSSRHWRSKGRAVIPLSAPKPTK